MKYWIEKVPYDVEPIVSRMEAFFDQEMARGGYSEMIPGVKKALLTMVIFTFYFFKKKKAKKKKI